MPKQDEILENEETIGADETAGMGPEELAEYNKSKLETEEKADEAAEPEKTVDGKEKPDVDEKTKPEAEPETTGDPLKDTQSALTKTKNELADLRKKIKEIQLENAKLKTGKFEKKSEEELENLKYTDPDAYIDYIKKEMEYEKANAESIEQEQAYMLEAQGKEVFDFFCEIMGTPMDPDVPMNKQPQEVQNFLNEFHQKGLRDQIHEYLKNKIKPNEHGIYSKDDFLHAYRALNFDSIVNEISENSKKGIREQTIADIDKAAKGGSIFDRSKAGNQKPVKTIKDYSPDEIDAMGPEELAELRKRANEELGIGFED